MIFFLGRLNCELLHRKNRSEGENNMLRNGFWKICLDSRVIASRYIYKFHYKKRDGFLNKALYISVFFCIRRSTACTMKSLRVYWLIADSYKVWLYFWIRVINSLYYVSQWGEHVRSAISDMPHRLAIRYRAVASDMPAAWFSVTQFRISETCCIHLFLISRAHVARAQ